MKFLIHTLLTLSIMILLTACGSTTAGESPNDTTTATKTIRALGATFEWQSDADTMQTWDDAQDYCAQKQMRLPSPEEFYALLDTNQSIDSLFPSDIKEFWTDKSYNADKAWKITSWSSSQSYHDKNDTLGVRCVKGDRLISHTFTKQANGLIDTNTQNTIQKKWQDENENSINRLTFTQATQYCEAKGMRLPTLFELQQITHAALDFVKNDDYLSYWSTTPQPIDSSAVMTVNFMTNGVLFSDKTANNHVRCVKDIDTIAPTINLVGSSDIALGQNDVYTEPGATAIDNQDGTLPVMINGTVDPSIVGIYTITYTATDHANNKASVTRTVTVHDQTAPTLTLHGSSRVILNQDSIFIDPGAIAIDTVDGNLSIMTTGSVDTHIPGNYTITYTATDSAGNTISKTRTVTVIDVTEPIITLHGSSDITLGQNESYIEQGATAVDAVDGVITVSTTGSVNTAVAGDYTITYSASDSANNRSTITRTVHILDTTPPHITLNGSNPQNILIGSTYTELGATANDNVDGDLTSAIMIDSSAVDTTKTGNYTVSYTVTDSSHHTSTLSRTVSIIDSTAPVITFTGANPQIIEVGSTYTELGATATDSVDGDLTSAIMIDSSAVDTTKTGNYTVSYNVSDSSANAAITVTREVHIVDSTPPVITLLGNPTININQYDAYTEPGATATDNVDGTVTVSITGSVDTAQVGTTVLHYSAVDSQGNQATASRTVNIIDMTAPNITLGGDNPMTVNINTPYVEPGATAIDAVDGNLTVHSSGSVDIHQAGSYVISYSAADLAGNAASKTRTVTVIDNIKPTITLSGAANIHVEVGTSYHDTGASATDNVDGNITADINATGSFNTNVIGSYTITYNVKDSAGNLATPVTRHIIVKDTTKPTISLIGSSSVTIALGSVYSDAGATAVDNYDGDISTSISIVNPVDWNSAGTYIVTFDVSDSSGNQAQQITRTVTVQAPVQNNFFTPHTVTTNAKDSEWLEMADLDNDGDIDILSAATGNGSKVAWYENHGNNTFTEHLLSSTANNPESIKASDMDNDGDLDILYTTYHPGGSIIQCLNNGNKTFSCAPLTTATDDLAFIEIADIDEDGKNDIISASWGQGRVDWYTNQGDGTFSTPHLIDKSNMNNAVSLRKADFNKDGHIDIVAASYGSNRVDWYENDGNGNFTPHFVADVHQAYSVDAADINGDGYDDIISTSNQNKKIFWHANDGNVNPSFTNTYTIVTNLTNLYYASGIDMDNDGDIDILSASSQINGKIVWYENIGENANFPEHIVASGVDNVIRVFASDIDNDGNMDVLAGDSAGNVILYENGAQETKLAKTGQTLSYDSGDDGYYKAGEQAVFTRDTTSEIVTDTTTGIMWEDDAQASSTPRTWDDANSYCKNLVMGGYSDWRLPEIQTLYFLAQKNQPESIDSTFINTIAGDYWSLDNTNNNATYVKFDNATESFAYTKDIGGIYTAPQKYVRCVRGKALTFKLIRNDTLPNMVIDHVHHLMWHDNNEANATTGDYQTALQYCEDATIGGYNNWRLPNIHELDSIVDPEKTFPAFNGLFHYTASKRYWSSTQRYNTSPVKVYTLDFSTGHDEGNKMTDSLHMRCVRDIP